MLDLAGNQSIRQFIPAVLLASVIFLAYLVVSEFILTIIWALIISYVTWPLFGLLKHRLNDNATLSAGIMTSIIAVIVILITFWLADTLKDELQVAYQTLAINFNHQPYQIPDSIRKIPWLGTYLQGWLEQLMNNRAGVATQIANWAKQWLGEFANFLGGIGHYVMKFGVILVTVFFCYRDGTYAVKQLHQGLIQSLGKYLDVYLLAIGSTTRAVVYGLVLAALGQGVTAGLGYAIAGVKAPVLFAMITALLALIPMGATLVWLPLGIMLIIADNFWSGVGLLAWGFLAISTVDNVIRPIVISGASRMPFLLIMFGVLGGLSAFGVIGLFLGPVILSVLLAVWKAWLEQQELEHKFSE